MIRREAGRPWSRPPALCFNILKPTPVLFALVLLIGTIAPATAAELLSVEAEGTQFKATMSDGRVLRSPDLVGAQLVIAVAARPILLRIDKVERDPDARFGEVWLHTLATLAENGSWQNACEAGPMEDVRVFRSPDGCESRTRSSYRPSPAPSS